MTVRQHPDSRERLLEAASALMWERSFQATGVDELCQRAQAKKGSFYHHFESKTDLAIAAIEHSWQLVQHQIFGPVFSTDESGLTQICNLVERVSEFQVQAAREHGGVLGCPFGNLGQEMARQDERIRMTLHNILLGHCKFFEEALDRAQRKGEIPPGNNKAKAENIFALLEGAMILAKVANDPQIFRRMANAALSLALT